MSYSIILYLLTAHNMEVVPVYIAFHARFRYNPGDKLEQEVNI